MAELERISDTDLRGKRQEIKALLQSARIFCREFGLGAIEGSAMVARTLATLRGYFPDTSSAGRMCSLLESAAILDPGKLQTLLCAFTPEEMVGALDVLEEALGLMATHDK